MYWTFKTVLRKVQLVSSLTRWLTLAFSFSRTCQPELLIAASPCKILMQHQSRPLCAALIWPDGASSVFVFQRCGGEHYTCSYSRPNLVQILFTFSGEPPQSTKITAEFKRNLCGLGLDARTVRQHPTCFWLAFFFFHCFYFQSCRCCRCEYVEEFFQKSFIFPWRWPRFRQLDSQGGETQRCLLIFSISGGSAKREKLDSFCNPACDFLSRFGFSCKPAWRSF